MRRRLTELVTPLKPIEAMAAGRLVLVSDVGGHKEIVEDGINGYMFEAGSHASFEAKLTEILACPAPQAMAAAARASDRARPFPPVDTGNLRLNRPAGLSRRLKPENTSSDHSDML